MLSREQVLAELQELRERTRELEAVLDRLSAKGGAGRVEESLPLVHVPQELKEPFEQAQRRVSDYFADLVKDPCQALIEHSGERYILIRAASMSTEFFDLVTSLYNDRGAQAARDVAQGFLFDVAHSLGRADAACFHERMSLVDPIEKLSAGPVHFAYTGWGVVHIHPDSIPIPDGTYFLHYDHAHSFEAEAWLKKGIHTDFPVCVMNAGYSAGWCEQSFGLPLVAAEVQCRARGDAHCRFVMAPPSRIHEHLARILGQAPAATTGNQGGATLAVPEVFRRKRMEDELRLARDELEVRVLQRTREIEARNVELRQANERLEELQRARDEFVATISHELRTPLVTGLGYIELLLKGRLGPVHGVARDGMKVALRNLRRLAGMVDDILTFHRLSRPEDALVPRPAPFDVGLLCRECIRDFMVRSACRSDRISVSQLDELPLVMADEEMVRRVVANLLDNAYRHAGPKAHINLRARKVGRHLRVSVSDDGAGIPREIRKRAFDPYVRSGSSGQGMGLGLTIVRSLLAAHGSELEIQTARSRGTKAAFLLPVATGVDLAGPAAAAEEWPADFTPVSELAGSLILVVDDDRDTASFLELLLSNKGFVVQTARTAEEALVCLAAHGADLVLVDMCLPGMSGVELCQRLKSDSGTRRLPVYIFTARAEEQARQEAMAAGCDGYLVKPLSVDELLERVREALARAR